MKHLKLFEQNFDDPFGEEIIFDNEIEGYFACWRHRGYPSNLFAKDYLEENKHKIKIHDTWEEARQEIKKDNWHDDCGCCVVTLFKDGRVSIQSGSQNPVFLH